jgi:hypothetical protein
MGVMAIWRCERLRVEPRAEPTPERAVAAAVERVVADA